MSSTPTTPEQNWEARWISAEGSFDPAYERTNAALRRWVDGMEQALLASSSSRRAGLPRSLALNPLPHRR
jgi:hypothetical protein